MPTAEETIPREEGYLVEFKAYSGGLSPKELAVTMTAFANTEGGAIYLGVTDRRLIQGVAVNATLLDHIQNAARCSPPVPISLRQIPVYRNKSVLQISVEKSDNPPPEFEANQDQVKVVFRRPRGGVAKHEMRPILDHYFSTHEQITRRQIEGLYGVGGTSAKTLIQSLLREGYVEKIGQGPGTRYTQRR